MCCCGAGCQHDGVHTGPHPPTTQQTQHTSCLIWEIDKRISHGFVWRYIILKSQKVERLVRVCGSGLFLSQHIDKTVALNHLFALVVTHKSRDSLLINGSGGFIISTGMMLFALLPNQTMLLKLSIRLNCKHKYVFVKEPNCNHIMFLV